MAEKIPAVDIAGDLTRESLIAISYSLPDKVSASPEPTVSTTANQNNGSGMDGFRSELISLSYSFPDDEPQPEVKG